MVEIGDEPNRVTIYKVMSSAPFVYTTNAYDLKHSWIHRNLGNEWRFRGSKHKGMTPPIINTDEYYIKYTRRRINIITMTS